MNHLLELTPSTMPVGNRRLRISIDSIESYESAKHHSDRHETIVRMKLGEVHYVDETVDSIDRTLNKLASAIAP